MKKSCFYGLMAVLLLAVILSGCGGGGSNPPNPPTYASGSQWASATSAAAFTARLNHTSVVYDNKMWVIGGDDESESSCLNDVWYSGDGVNGPKSLSTCLFRRGSVIPALFMTTRCGSLVVMTVQTT